MTSYCQGVNGLLETHTADDIVSKTGLEVMGFKQTANQGAVEDVPALSMKELHCRPDYDEYGLKRTFIEELK